MTFENQLSIGNVGNYNLSNIVSSLFAQLVMYEGHPIKDKDEFDQLIEQSQQISKKLKVYIIDLSTQAADKKIDPVTFREICEAIILNHINYGNNLSAIRSDMKHLLDNFSVVITNDGTHYGDNTTGRPVQFQKHVAKYPGGELRISNYFWYEDNDAFVGPFVSGRKFGIAQFISVGGEKCTCAFNADNKFGFGQYKWTDGDVYEGDFTSDVMTGKGVIKYTDGDIYEGDFVNGQRCGFGKCRFANGDEFEGQYYVNGEERINQGTLKYANGDQYNGQMKYYYDVDKRLRCGLGKLIKKDGEVQQGNWEKDSLIKQQ